MLSRLSLPCVKQAIFPLLEVNIKFLLSGMSTREVYSGVAKLAPQ